MSETKTKMKYVNLGKSGLKVSRSAIEAEQVYATLLTTCRQVSKLILGCMQYGSGQEWMIADHDEGVRQLKYAYDQGINVSGGSRFALPEITTHPVERLLTAVDL
jgi:hypothetical protein